MVSLVAAKGPSSSLRVALSSLGLGDTCAGTHVCVSQLVGRQLSTERVGWRSATPTGLFSFRQTNLNGRVHTRAGASRSRTILGNSMGQIRELNSLAEEPSPRRHQARTRTPEEVLRQASRANALLHPSLAALVQPAFSLFQPATGSPSFLPSALSYFIYLFPFLSVFPSQARRAHRSGAVSEQQRSKKKNKQKKPRGNVPGIAFILLKTRPFFSLCVGHGQPQLFTRFNTDRTTNGFSLLCPPPKPQPAFFPRLLCGHCVHS